MSNTKAYLSMRKYAQYLKKRCLSHHQGDAPNIFLFASRRGGSTLLAQAIAAEPGVWFANEPFACFEGHEQYDELLKWLPLLPDSQFFDLSPDQEKQVELYLKKLLSAGIPSLGECSRPKFPLMTDRVLMKILNAPFLVDYFSTIGNCHILFISRHPAPQTLSVLRNKWGWSALTYFSNTKFIGQYFSSEQIEFGQRILSEGTEWEKGIINWVMETYFPLYLTKSEVLYITYEALVLDTENVIDNICEHLRLRDKKSMIDTIKKPSYSSGLSDSLTRRMISEGNREFLIAKWQDKITKKQLEKGQRILDIFNVKIYSMYNLLPINS